MKNCLAHDFSTLYSYLWYSGFPLDGWNRDNGSISDWTTHSAITFRNTADLFGYFVHFESGGNKTDAVLRDRNGENIAFAEWEWKDPASERINEPQKLASAWEQYRPHFCFLLTYVEEGALREAVREICEEWENDGLLILCVVTYQRAGLREFKELVFFEVCQGKDKVIRRQPALPWNIKGTKWQLD